MDSQSRRRERRATKQAEWKQDNPLLVGVSAKPTREVLTMKGKSGSRVDKAISVRSTKVYDSLNNCCLPQVAIFSVNRRKDKALTARG